MDSITQMVLGAAVGELVLGRKIGNKAMFWGAVGGTIPDLDVLANPFLTEAESVKFHRGPSHSLFFSFVASALFAFLLRKYFGSDLFHHKWWRAVWRVVFTGLPLSILGLIVYIGWGGLSPILLLVISIVLIWLARLAWRRSPLNQENIEEPEFREWYWFFFLVFATHIALDVLTTYGTQVLWPFWDYPFAWDTISIVDPLYTVPFILLIFAASFYGAKSSVRYKLNLAGILISSAYLLFTMFNKLHVNRVFEKTMALEKIEVIDYRTSPTLFNNLLWYGIAETDTSFVKGYYSLLDEERRFHQLEEIPKNHDLLLRGVISRDIEILKWFSGGFHSISEEEGEINWHDLRFGNIDFTGTDASQASPFLFRLKKNDEGKWKVLRDRPEFEGEPGEIFRAFWLRIIGEK